MMMKLRLPLMLLLGALAILAAVTAFDLLGLSGRLVAGSPAPYWEAVNPEVPVGKSVRLKVRLIGADGEPMEHGVTVTATRLDMGPEGMAAMVTVLRPAPSPAPGILAFDADLIMAGRWALTITATVHGQQNPISNVVIFRAAEKSSDASGAPAASAPGARPALYYRNPMGLPDISPVPKKDPMGMDYVPVYEDEAAAPSKGIRISPGKVQRAGVRTAVVEQRTFGRTVRAVATVVPDESRLAILTPKFDGFVEELFVSLTGAEIRAGQPLLRVWIESREILQKQADYLNVLRSTGIRAGDAERAANNLRLFGIPDQAIEAIKLSGQPVRSVVLRAPSAGTVLEKPATVGMRFSAGDVLFRTADLSTVWVMAQVSERDLGLIRVGQRVLVTLTAYPEWPQTGRVAFIYPEIVVATRTAPVRIELPNPERRIKNGLYADVDFDAAFGREKVVAIPESALIDTGRRQIAFVAKGEGVFEPRDVTLGRRGNGFVEIRSGLAEGELIVVHGNFLIDAESNLQAALAAFTASQKAR